MSFMFSSQSNRKTRTTFLLYNASSSLLYASHSSREKYYNWKILWEKYYLEIPQFKALISWNLRSYTGDFGILKAWLVPRCFMLNWYKITTWERHGIFTCNTCIPSRQHSSTFGLTNILCKQFWVLNAPRGEYCLTTNCLPEQGINISIHIFSVISQSFGSFTVNQNEVWCKFPWHNKLVFYRSTFLTYEAVIYSPIFH